MTARTDLQSSVARERGFKKTKPGDPEIWNDKVLYRAISRPHRSKPGRAYNLGLCAPNSPWQKCSRAKMGDCHPIFVRRTPLFSTQPNDENRWLYPFSRRWTYTTDS